jgi:hypothetical protein
VDDDDLQNLAANILQHPGLAQLKAVLNNNYDQSWNALFYALLHAVFETKCDNDVHLQYSKRFGPELPTLNVNLPNGTFLFIILTTEHELFYCDPKANAGSELL